MPQSIVHNRTAMSDSPQPDWITFLHLLGVEVRKLSSDRQGQISVFVSVPFVDYTGLLIASGILIEKYRDTKTAELNPEDFLDHQDKPISFPFEKRREIVELKRLFGTVAGSHSSKNGPRLAVKYRENQKITCTHYVHPRWLPSVRKIEETPNLQNLQHGSRLVSDLGMLDSILGESGTAALIAASSKDCLILDVKKRVEDELRTYVDVNRFGHCGNGSLLFADLIRPASSGCDATRETFSSQIASEPESGWDHAIICGSLNLLKHWDECDYRVRVAILGTSENAYSEAVCFANELYFQRAIDLKVSERLLSVKPPHFDLQLFASA
jgi:hypothetical protein